MENEEIQEQPAIPANLDWFEDPNAGYDPENQDKPAKKDDGQELREQLDAALREIEALKNRDELPMVPQFGNVPQFRTDVDMSNLPDPVTDKDGYARELNARIQAAMDQRAQQAQWQAAQQNDLQTKTTQLWEDFQDAHPEYSNNYQLVEAAALSVVNKQRAKGVDVNRLMFNRQDRFFKMVDDEIHSMVQGLIPEQDDGDEEEQKPRRANRTGGIFGGTEGGGRPAKGADRPARKDDLLNDLRDWQLKTGYHG